MKILICDDHAIFRSGVRSVLEDLGIEAETVEATNAPEAFEVVDSGGIDLVLLDLNLPSVDGWEALHRLRETHPALPVVILSESESADDVRTALARGASGFIPKSSRREVLRGALDLVASGSVYVPPVGISVASEGLPQRQSRQVSDADSLTPRQLEVLRLLARGLTNREIAGVLGIREGTVKVHVSALFDALDVTNRTEAALVMRELDLDDSD